MARENTLARKEDRPLGVWEPWSVLNEMDRMFRDFFAQPGAWWRRPAWITDLTGRFTPQVDIKETEKDFVLTATIPGMEKDDIDINVTSDTVTISGERKCEEEKPDEKYHLRQQSYGAFNVSYSLPSEIKTKDVKAAYKNGILEVTLPKVTQAKASQKVKIEG